jgi:hypothetical protein
VEIIVEYEKSHSCFKDLPRNSHRKFEIFYRNKDKSIKIGVESQK